MASMLDRLLSIQGATEQISIENAMQNAAPPPRSDKPAADPEQDRERDNWRAAYLIYAKYAPQLAAAAAEADSENESAIKVFTAAIDDCNALFEQGEIAGALAVAVYELLDKKYKLEQKRTAEASVARAAV